MPKMDTNALNMPGHVQRNQTGRLRKIRIDTQVETLEKRYGVDFRRRSNMEWGALKEELGVSSVGEALKKARKNS
ncbi:MAG: hypothetical protein A2669_00520 [Candidatus Yanofskybacteria bacterium RIFCSPHIGHO2_01_FULL_48_25b]|uniref:Uncharacterized protein n=1 Tax=Candidatus Yanofskybacteria bacterium RIFCSPHIGHO2_01_FULL_48_25b TaxID=1802672 RepID=A0A1F8F268_9BACT|nr:MAG: hypothetical protein A2669_00520 [Candidatus Yanofskybacteria bacterium RIFCSPHIGHO2_01_FULL_48_25b]